MPFSSDSALASVSTRNLLNSDFISALSADQLFFGEDLGCVSHSFSCRMMREILFIGGMLIRIANPASPHTGIIVRIVPPRVFIMLIRI